MFVCSGVVAEKTDSQLFFFDKSAITSAAVSFEGQCTGRYCKILFIFFVIIAAFNVFNADVNKCWFMSDYSRVSVAECEYVACEFVRSVLVSNLSHSEKV